MSHTDEELAGMLARDIEKHLASVHVADPVFGIALWIDHGYAESEGRAGYGLSVGSTADIRDRRSAPAFRDTTDEQWSRWAAGEYWNSGSWRHGSWSLLAPDTEQALGPLRDLIRTEELDPTKGSWCEYAWPTPCLPPGAQRWTEVGIRALEIITLPPALPITADLLVFSEGPDLTCVRRTVAMLRSVSPSRFHDVFLPGDVWPPRCGPRSRMRRCWPTYGSGCDASTIGSRALGFP